MPTFVKNPNIQFNENPFWRTTLLTDIQRSSCSNIRIIQHDAKIYRTPTLQKTLPLHYKAELVDVV